MVSNRRSEYGFKGYQVPAMPRAPRSARRRGPIPKKIDDQKMRAFDLLATVAGELLLEKDVYSSSNNSSSSHEDQSPVVEASAVYSNKLLDHCKPIEIKTSIHENCGPSFVVPELVSWDKDQDSGSALKAKDDSVSSAMDMDLSGDNRSNSSQEDEVRVPNKDPLLNHGKLACCGVTDLCSLGGSMKSISNDRRVVSRDDDDKLSGCIHLSTMKKKSFASVPHIGARRIRKILASKYWKAPKLKADRRDGDLKIAYRDRMGCYRHQRFQRNYPFKKRFSDVNCIKNFDVRDRSMAPEKGINGDKSGNGPSSPLKACQHSSFRRRNSHVKLRIKSFRVPELFIEVAETSTVGSLKRTVMEALNAILGGGVRIGVLLRGNKVRDDSKTLLQSGISHDNQPDALGFTLEPNSSLAPGGESPGLSHAVIPSDASHPLAGCAADPVAYQEASLLLTEPHGDNMGKLIEKDHHNSAARPSPIEMPMDEGSVDSRALGPVPSTSSREPLPVAPVQQRLGKSEIAPRRVRRPFSVAEVEALVETVEKLGTGRWRDVKVRAFDGAEHRTYVDLKDKWKTLVHTAKISPQQRRGEPVPQELLHRVLAAHAYWSQQQSKAITTAGVMFKEAHN